MKYTVKGLDKLLSQLADMSNFLVFDQEARKALDAGADVVGDITRKELENLTVDNRNYVLDGRKGIMQIQKNALLKSFGITPIQEVKNKIDRKTGVSYGTNELGQPNVVIARRLENGTSYMPKNPVFSRASRKARSQCLKAMEESLNNSINKLWNR